jgi:hypothetical protein
MLFLVVCWIGLFGVSTIVGLAVLTWLNADDIKSVGDRLILAVWSGTVIIASTLLTLSLVTPLTSSISVGVVLGWLGVALSARRLRIHLRILTYSIRVWHIFLWVCLASISAITAQQRTLYDTGLYHAQVIRWLSQFGTVPGLALIHKRFGFASSWFALAAPFDEGVFQGRVIAVLGGYAFLLAGVHVSLAIARLWQGRDRLDDWFILIAGCFCLPFVVVQSMVASTSPNLPIVLLTVVVAWSILVLCRQPLHLQAGYEGIPLLLAVGAVAVKLTALPLLVGATGFYFTRHKPNASQYLKYGFIVAPFLIPTLLFGVVTSACPLFPSSIACLDFLSWSVGSEQAKALSRLVQSWAQWSGPLPATATSWNWILHWLVTEKEAAFLLGCSGLAIAGLILVFKNLGVADFWDKFWVEREEERLKQCQNLLSDIPGLLFVVLIGVSGITLFLVAGPDLRYGFGYLILFPTLLCAVYAKNNDAKLALVPILVGVLIGLSYYGLKRLNPVNLAIYLGVCCILCVGLWSGLRRSDRLFHQPTDPRVVPSLLATLLLISLFQVSQPRISRSSWLLPKQLPVLNQGQLITQQTNDVTYTRPAKGERCWASALPCTPRLLHNDIWLLAPEKGLQGGFSRRKP